jgi:predicted ribonuclease YlaK
VLDENTARPYPLITLEAEFQGDRLRSLADDLRLALAQFELPKDGLAVVVDTNVFLHREFFKDSDWPRLVGAKEVRLVIPLVVVEELDAQAYKSQANATRARKVLRAFRELESGAATPEAPVRVRDSVTLQFLMDPAGHERSSNHDEEILDRTEHLGTLVDVAKLRVATMDVSMQLRASLRGLSTLVLEPESAS